MYHLPPVSTFKNRYKNKWLCCLLDVSWELYWLPLMEKTVPRKSLSVELKSQGLTPGLTSLFHSPPRLAVLMHMGEKLQLTSSVPQELMKPSGKQWCTWPTHTMAPEWPCTACGTAHPR